MTNEKIDALVSDAKAALDAIKTEAALNAWEVKFLGRKSELSMLLRGLKDLAVEEKRVFGPLMNQAKGELSKLLQDTRANLMEKNRDWESERLDVTVPQKLKRGHLHPITQVVFEIEDIFTSMGFAVADGPEVESDYNNFDALNFPKDHPSRDMQDTFWLKWEKNQKERYLPRTHTSSVQVRHMQAHKPPFRIIIPGKIFRNEATDASHEHTFHQFECLMVDTAGKVNVAHFKYISEKFFEAFFKQPVDVRLRPSFFPFTEPSFEFDISCVLCGGQGCSVCKQSGWLEIGGAGMVNQKVFEAAGYKRGAYQGFAWGFGLTRLAMMKFKTPDIRAFMEGDLRFIRQF